MSATDGAAARVRRWLRDTVPGDLARVVVTNGCPSIGIVEAAFVIAAFDDALVLVAEVKRLRALVGEASE